MDFHLILFLIILSFIPSLFWLFFYFYYSPQFTTSRGILLALFFLGMGSALFAALAERGVFRIIEATKICFFDNCFRLDFILATFNKYFYGASPEKTSEVLIIFLLMFLFVAPVEEFLKFLAIKIIIKKWPQHLNQIIDGIKFGIVTGLGFAVIENGIYFQTPLFSGQETLLIKLFLLRFFIATLGHSLYTGIVGYYLGLSHFYRLYAKRFIKRGLLIAIFIHAIFNFFLLVNIGFYSVILMIIMLLFMIKWYQDRKNLETYIVEGKYEIIRPPIFSERPEFESILAKNQVTYNFIKTLNLCPFCLKKRKPGEEICSYCGQRAKRQEYKNLKT